LSLGRGVHIARVSQKTVKRGKQPDSKKKKGKLNNSNKMENDSSRAQSTGPEAEIEAAEAEFTAKKQEENQNEPSDRRTIDHSSTADHHHHHPADDRIIESNNHEEQPRKKLKLTDADKKRSARMFGSLMGTLSKFQDETSKTKQTEAAKRRAAVENRLQTKLKLEAESLHRLRACEAEETSLKQHVLRKTDELGHLSQLHKIKFANKLAFSHYLRTSDKMTSSKLIPDETDQNEPGDLKSTAIYDRIIRPRQSIYWLPNKLLPEQKEFIDNQRRETREEVEEEQHQWEEERLTKEEELEKLQAQRDKRLIEIQAEKAKARSSNAGPTESTNSDHAASSKPVIGNEMDVDRRRLTPSEIRQDTPDLNTNDNLGRDEDAVEY
ncbi:hypothetical protein PSTT_05119, partial [Puccinia striiformis]